MLIGSLVARVMHLHNSGLQLQGRHGLHLYVLLQRGSLPVLPPVHDKAMDLSPRQCWVQVHAALAVMLYSEQPPALSRAESQWELAGEFDSRFADVSWVARERHWPPSMVAALQHFLAMS